MKPRRVADFDPYLAWSFLQAFHTISQISNKGSIIAPILLLVLILSKGLSANDDRQPCHLTINMFIKFIPNISIYSFDKRMNIWLNSLVFIQNIWSKIISRNKFCRNHIIWSFYTTRWIIFVILFEKQIHEEEIFSINGSDWYFIVDTNIQTIKLNRKTNIVPIELIH